MKEPGALDLRLVPVAVAAWSASAATLLVAAGLLPRLAAAAGVGSVAVAALVVLVAVAGRRSAVALALLGAIAGAGVVALHLAAWRADVLGALADRGGLVTVDVVIAGEPRVLPGQVIGGRPLPGAVEVAVDVAAVVAGAPSVLVLPGVPATLRLPDSRSGDVRPAAALPGDRWRVRAAVEPGEVLRRTAVRLVARGQPELLSEAGGVAALTAGVRDAFASAAQPSPGDGPALLPGLVLGDTRAIDADLQDAMRGSGLLHLTAVSGANVALLLGAVLLAARWAGIRGRWVVVPCGLALAGFVVLVRPEPSVVRAATMGVVALVALLVGTRRAGVPALAAAVLVLVLLDPWLAVSVGFALSVLATAALLVVAPPLVRVLGRRLPRAPAILVAAVAATAAAQVTTAPLVAGIDGGVVLAGLPANLLAAPAVAPATVIGVAAALVAPLSPGLGAVVAWPAGAAAAWIGVVARWCARLPGAVIEWPGGVGGAFLLAAVLLAGTCAAASIGWLVRQRPAARGPVATLTVLGIVFSLARVSAIAPWPPVGWAFVVCDVGQGDALVLAAGGDAAVVVDVGPDPAAVRRCLTDLGVGDVPLLVLSHFHADHVAGLRGVLATHSVGAALVSGLDEPQDRATEVRRALHDAGVPVQVGESGQRWEVGEVSLDVLWPRSSTPSGGANDASVVLLARVRGLRILLGGDLEPPAQAALVRTPTPAADVVKVPHHGSRYQDPRFPAWSGARLAVISVGADNDYGHPAAQTIASYPGAVLRTDTNGDVAVVLTDGIPGVVARHGQ